MVCSSAVIAQDPLTAIDWLNDAPATLEPAPIAEPEVTRGVVSDAITVTSLDAPAADAVGLLPSAVSGFPADLWGRSPSQALITAMDALDNDHLLPATRELLQRLMLAELEPPFDATGDTFFLARVDTLTRLGWVESAKALLDRAGAETPERFRRWFDLSLILGTESEACQLLAVRPALSPSLAATVFCLARGGDWSAAALSFETAAALGQLTELEEALLLKFLDPELGELGTLDYDPGDLDVLTFRLFEAVGEPVPSAPMPVAFSYADLGSQSGWKAQIEAAERLARVGALPGNKLLGLYTERRPAASGGIWTRVEAVQVFELALASESDEALNRAFPIVWDEMQKAGLGYVFAEVYTESLGQKLLAGDASKLGFVVGLLSQNYETLAQAHRPRDGAERFFKALARGDLAGVVPPDERSAALADAFLIADGGNSDRNSLSSQSMGETILSAIRKLGEGAQGDLAKLSDATATLRHLNLEDVARRASLQVLILGKPG